MSKCQWCGKPEEHHLAKSQACPIGKKHRTLGYTAYHRTQWFTPKPGEKEPPPKPACEGLFNGCTFVDGVCIHCKLPAERPQDQAPPKAPRKRLRVRWSKKEKDLYYLWDADMQGKANCALLNTYFEHVTFDIHNVHGEVIKKGKTLRQELEERGFDLTTLRFQIDKKA